MQINAINSSPAFSSKNYSKEDVQELTEILGPVIRQEPGEDRYTQVYDDFSEDENETETPAEKKNIIETAAAVAGATLLMFITGKSAAQITMNKLPVTSGKIIGAASKAADTIANKVQAIIADGNTNKIFGKFLQGSSEIASKFNKIISAKGEKVANLAGIATAATIVPGLITADDGDGIPDIAQKGKNAYETYLGSLDKVQKLANILA